MTKLKKDKETKPVATKGHTSVQQAPVEQFQEINTAFREYPLFKSLNQENKNKIRPSDLKAAIESSGIKLTDTRLKGCLDSLAQFNDKSGVQFNDFCDIMSPNVLLVEKILQRELVIPDFQQFQSDIETCYKNVLGNTKGKVSQHIPQLAKVKPDQSAVSICTVDGARIDFGDSETFFSLQACVNPLNYCVAVQEHGTDEIGKWVGREPSGRSFNDVSVNEDGKPHNPMLNSGALVTASMIKSKSPQSDRFSFVNETLVRMAGGEPVKYDTSMFLSELQKSDRNFALSYFLKEKKAFPYDVNVRENLEFYIHTGAIEVNTSLLSVIAGTLANAGICPTTEERVFAPKTVQDCLSLLASCGMNEHSGEFSFQIGLPGKSGISGATMIIIPNVMGICFWSPRIDSAGNSAMGYNFCEQLVKTFNFHNFDSLRSHSGKKDPRTDTLGEEAQAITRLLLAADKGDMASIQRELLHGSQLDMVDYDQRSILHTAAAEGRTNVIKFAIEKGLNLSMRDRWGKTPLDEATSNYQEKAIKRLKAGGAVAGEADNENWTWFKEKENQNYSHYEFVSAVEMIFAAYKGKLSNIRALVAKGVSLECSDYSQRTPLHLAAAEGHIEVVDYLVQNGVEVNAQDKWGGTPLEDATRHDRKDVIARLKQANAKL